MKLRDRFLAGSRGRIAGLVSTCLLINNMLICTLLMLQDSEDATLKMLVFDRLGFSPYSGIAAVQSTYSAFFETDA